MEALGLIETKGLVAAIEAADAMVKTHRSATARISGTGQVGSRPAKEVGPSISISSFVRKAQMIGLRELTRNLARIQGWTSTATKSE